MAEALESLSIQSVLVTPAANGFAPMTMAVGLLPDVFPPTAPPATIPAENPPERFALAFSDGVSFRYSSQDIAGSDCSTVSLSTVAASLASWFSDGTSAAYSSVFTDVTSSVTALTLLSTGTASAISADLAFLAFTICFIPTFAASCFLPTATSANDTDSADFTSAMSSVNVLSTGSGTAASTGSDAATSAVMPPKALTLLSLTLVTTKIPAISAAAAESPQNQTGMTFLRLSCSPAFSLSAAHNSSDGRSS